LKFDTKKGYRYRSQINGGFSLRDLFSDRFSWQHQALAAFIGSEPSASNAQAARVLAETALEGESALDSRTAQAKFCESLGGSQPHWAACFLRHSEFIVFRRRLPIP